MCVHATCIFSAFCSPSISLSPFLSLSLSLSLSLFLSLSLSLSPSLSISLPFSPSLSLSPYPSLSLSLSLLPPPLSLSLSPSLSLPPSPLSLSLYLSFMQVVLCPSCANSCNGSAGWEPFNGTPEYTYTCQLFFSVSLCFVFLTDLKHGKAMLGGLDYSYLFAYAIGMFFRYFIELFV